MATDVLLVNLPPHESYYADGTPHLGLLYVLTSLRNHGYTASYLDCSGRGIRRQQILTAIADAEPRLVGFSIDTDNLRPAGQLSRTLKQQLGPTVPIVFGGPASQGQPDEIMKCSAADVLVIGEGEHTACEVADCLLQGRGRLADIPGICHRTADGGFTFTAPRPPIQDLDAIAIPDRDFLKTSDGGVTMITGRGCPFRCTFCFEGRMGNKYRHRSPENILAEIEYLVSYYGRPYICINDDTFTANPQHTMEVCRLIRERFTPWKDLLLFCEARIDVIDRHPELIDALVGAGVVRVQLGVESADPDVLRAYKRLNVKPEAVRRVVGRLHDAGMPSIYCGFIAGGPRETLASMERTLAFASDLMVNVAPGSFECYASFLTPLPGTDLRAQPERYGLRLLDPDLLTSSNFNYCVAETETLDQAVINNFRLRFIEEMDRLMCQVISTLPRRVIEVHDRLRKDFNVVTFFNDRFKRFPRLVEYLGSVGTGRLEPAHALTDEEVLDRFPTRLSVPVVMEQDRVIVTRGPSKLTLNGLGSRIFGLCSGKLTTRELIHHLASGLGESAPPRDALQADVLRFVRHLDDNYAVYLKDY